ncbi:hypothetical protein [Glycomyces algeriensis]|uniref:Uncharacterized protein n=1 Tax=Glycomyces algeriensis TaxID=256037 RepID=A0A9W6G7P9_9ACTN|nr:hypothetical protein [Glycomyces algeriensis]MDA1366081.1 hypothetical protein [Glycomyces algeriensis]MDR7349152.1 hypothetical protein [Glycomyces algeriensis]GLI41852.1 hypothetical protein GALLR39Z86_17020 [Glycomyces algeriensis]
MRRAAITLLAGAFAVAGCSDPKTEVTAEDITAIEASIVNGSALAWELSQAEARVASICMQDEGFTVHNSSALHGNTYPNRFEGFDAPYSRIPTVEQAQEFGFGIWVWASESEEALAMREDLDFLAFTAEEQGWSDPAENAAYAEWDATDEEYKDAWTVAFVGPERAAYEKAMSEAYEGADTPEEVEAVDTEALGPQPPFGGCELKTIETVYGEVLHREIDGEDYWSRPDLESPLTWIGDGELYAELSNDYADQEEDFLICVEDRGYGEWDFDDLGWLPTWQYLGQVEGSGVDDQGEELPPLPDDAEDADPVAFELAMALDFAECAEESGLREGSDEAWARMSVERVIDRESEVYAWEQEIEEYLANAQDYLAGK